MSFRSKGLVLAMEDDAPVVQVEINAENEVPAEVEADAAELTEQAGEVEDLVTAVEEAEQDAETLGRMAEVMEESADKGEGLDETAAEIAEVAVEAICGRLGIRTHGRAMPALESFGSRSSRVSATRISVEGIKEWITTTWEAIKKAFKDMWTKVKTFFEKFFVANERLKSAAKKMKENLSVGDTPKNVAFEDKSISSQFPLVAMFNESTVLKELSYHKGAIDSVLTFVGGVDSAVADVNKTVEAALKVEGDAKKAEAVKIQEAIQQFIVKSTINAKGGFMDSVPTGAVNSISRDDVCISSPILAGGNIVIIRQINSKDEAKTGAHYSASVVPAVSAETIKKSESTSLRTLNKKEMDNILGQVIDLCDVNTQLRNKANAIGNIEKKFDAVVGSAIKAAENLDSDSKVNESVKEVLTAAKNTLSGIGRAAGVLTTAVPRLSVQAGKAALSYVSKSAAQYKK